MVSLALKMMLLLVLVGVTLPFFSMTHSHVIINENGWIELYNPSNETATLNNCSVKYRVDNGSTFSIPVDLVALEPYSSHVVKVVCNNLPSSIFCDFRGSD